MNEKQLLDKIAEMLRKAYPDAVSVQVFVNHQEVEIETKYRRYDGMVSMRTLSGDWVKEGESDG